MTGYNVYVSATASLPVAAWYRAGYNVSDMDSETPSVQWSDTTGELPPDVPIRYYRVAAYNALCDAEGPQ